MKYMCIMFAFFCVYATAYHIQRCRRYVKQTYLSVSLGKNNTFVVSANGRYSDNGSAFTMRSNGGHILETTVGRFKVRLAHTRTTIIAEMATNVQERHRFLFSPCRTAGNKIMYIKKCRIISPISDTSIFLTPSNNGSLSWGRSATDRIAYFKCFNGHY